ncbi:hypothetical protein A9Q68_10170 [Streptococcus bovimastitidis]|uniref:DNA-binding protein n=1 Tax=Streptococcus bovimastitidis TaxID=1856638 RepID=A0A1L8MK11_9STRE|nr:hypothetical protein [Streptococcus bovimastitidis]OJF71078.1 hypothetical protein A9Q68_10170 [Streptococcus bovimastitidis]
MDDIFKKLSDWIREQIESVTNDIVRLKTEELNATLWTREEVCNKMNLSPTTFDNYYRYDPTFPKELPAKRWKKAEVLAWLNGNY